MDEIRKGFFELLAQSIGKKTTKNQYTQKEQIYLEFQKRKMCPLMYDTIRKSDVGFVAGSLSEEFKKSAVEMAISYHVMFAFYRTLHEWLHQNQIQYVLLKGFSLAMLYPMDEMRTFQDVDIYVPDDAQFKMVEEYFAQKGYHASEKSTGHHKEYYAPMPGGQVVKCELHRHLVSEHIDTKTFRYIENCFAQAVKLNTHVIEVLDIKIPVLPPTENLWYLILHMMHHFLGYGIGIYPLVDITLFLEQNENGIEIEKLYKYLSQTKSTIFAKSIFYICKEQLQMKENRILKGMEYNESDKALAKELLEDLWEFDEDDVLNSRSPIRMDKNRVVSYIRICHAQMKYHYPKASKLFVTWPFLWMKTICIFLKTQKRNGTKEVLIKNRERTALAMRLIK